MTDKLETSRSPSMTEVLRQIMSQVSDRLYVALPGKVEFYDPILQTVDVKPLLSKTIVDQSAGEEKTELPVLPKVPVAFPRGGDFFMVLPISPGDNVLLVFCDRSIDDYWFSDGSRPMDQVDFRSHDISDAVAIPGFYPSIKPVLDSSATSLVLGKDKKGKQIAVTPTSTVEITSNLQNVLTLALEGALTTMQVGDGLKHVAVVETLQALWTSMKATIDTWANTHTHPTGVGPSGVATPSLSTDIWNVSINSTKVSIPDG